MLDLRCQAHAGCAVHQKRYRLHANVGLVGLTFSIVCGHRLPRTARVLSDEIRHMLILAQFQLLSLRLGLDCHDFPAPQLLLQSVRLLFGRDRLT